MEINKIQISACLDSTIKSKSLVLWPLELYE